MSEANSSPQLDLFSYWTNPVEDAVVRLFPQAESVVLEYKSAKGGFPDSFWETYSAFANTEGGVIVLGIREREYELLMDGLTEAQVQKYRRDFFTTANNRGKISRNLLTDRDVQAFRISGEGAASWLLAFRIPRAGREQRPVYKGMDLHKVDISTLLKRLCDEGFLQPDGWGRGRKYTLRTDYLKNALAGAGDLQNLARSGENLASSRENLASSGRNLASKHGRQNEKLILREAVLQLLAADFMTTANISKAINKSKDYLRNEVLGKMVEEGLLILRFPETPRHPQQAYKAASPKE